MLQICYNCKGVRKCGMHILWAIYLSKEMLFSPTMHWHTLLFFTPPLPFLESFQDYNQIHVTHGSNRLSLPTLLPQPNKTHLRSHGGAMTHRSVFETHSLARSTSSAPSLTPHMAMSGLCEEDIIHWRSPKGGILLQMRWILFWENWEHSCVFLKTGTPETAWGEKLEEDEGRRKGVNVTDEYVNVIECHSRGFSHALMQ